jgi:DNA-binding SARP family transcriptional activator/tetratricopeptide (TPR) repeat protein
MDDHSDNAPFVRIWLCGPLLIEWIDPATGVVRSCADGSAGGRDAVAAAALMALLLCQPNRQAHRDWLMEQFWPESSRSVSVHRMENIFSYLRKLLRPPTGEESLAYSIHGKKGGGPSYGITRYPSVWVDRDALIWNSQQAARMERFGDDALPYWERAYALLKRGPFLADEPYDSYADWMVEQREQLAGHERHCVHALSRLYPARYGEVGKEEALLLLRTYWLAHKTDEDALRPLMELLGEQERYQEAEEYYQQLLLKLGEDGEQREPDIRTCDIREFLQSKQIERKHQQVTPYIKYTGSAENDLKQNIDSLSTIQHINRREASKKIMIAGASLLLPAYLFDFMHEGKLLHEDEILALSTTVLPILWRLYFDGYLSEVHYHLPHFLSQLAILAHQPSHSQQQAASLSSKAHQLSCMLALQTRNYGLALLHTEHAQTLALAAEEPNVLVASLIRKALTYRYINRYLRPCPDQIMDAYQEAIPSSNGISPLLQGRLFTGLAEVYSERGQAYEARSAIDHAYAVFPEHPQSDPHFSYTHFKLPQKFEAIMYLNLKEGQKAWNLLTSLETAIPSTTVPDRVELFLDQTRAALLINDLEACCAYLQTSVKAATELGSELRYHEAYRIYQQMFKRWPHERKVLDLDHLFRA